MSDREQPRLLVAKDKNDLDRLVADTIFRKIQEAVRARNVCAIALSGGSTPVTAYTLLGSPPLGDKIPWAQVEIYFADERAVAIDHPDSNYHLVRTTMLKNHPEAWGLMYRMPADAADPEAAADQYARRLPHPLDVLVLGMGHDGHIASLFPGSPALDERERRVVPVTGAPKPPSCRMTITPPVIEAARQIVMIVSGVEKAYMVSRALGGLVDPKIVPALLARRATWIVDHAAAGAVLNP